MAEKTQRGSNLSQADRERGGKASAAKQVRDARGQFAGTKDRESQKREHGHGRTSSTELREQPRNQDQEQIQEGDRGRNQGGNEMDQE